MPLWLPLALLSLASLHPLEAHDWPGRGKLIFQEDFQTFNYTRWNHLVTGSRSGDEFQYYASLSENRHVSAHAPLRGQIVN